MFIDLQKELGIDKIYALVLDKRFNDWQNKKDKLKFELGLQIKDFIVGNGSCPYFKYDRLDIDKTAPLYPETISYLPWIKHKSSYNAFLSHRGILQNAKKENLNSILLLEDDVVLQENYREILIDVLETIKHINYDVLYLGGFYKQEKLFGFPQTKYLYRTLGNGGWHSVIIKRRLFDFFIDHLAIAPMDHICETKICANRNYMCLAIHPSILMQESNYSYVEKGFVNREKVNNF